MPGHRKSGSLLVAETDKGSHLKTKRSIRPTKHAGSDWDHPPKHVSFFVSKSQEFQTTSAGGNSATPPTPQHPTRLFSASNGDGLSAIVQVLPLSKEVDQHVGLEPQTLRQIRRSSLFLSDSWMWFVYLQCLGNPSYWLQRFELVIFSF